MHSWGNEWSWPENLITMFNDSGETPLCSIDGEENRFPCLLSPPAAVLLDWETPDSVVKASPSAFEHFQGSPCLYVGCLCECTWDISTFTLRFSNDFNPLVPKRTCHCRKRLNELIFRNKTFSISISKLRWTKNLNKVKENSKNKNKTKQNNQLLAGAYKWTKDWSSLKTLSCSSFFWFRICGF